MAKKRKTTARKRSKVTCPHCKTCCLVLCPKTKCVKSCKCKECGKAIKAKKCCVFCEFGNKSCCK